MIRYNLGNLSEWRPVGAGELVGFPLGDAKVRTVQFDMLCDGPTAVFATRAQRDQGNLPDDLKSSEFFEATWLVGYSPGGQASFRFAASTDVGVYCQTDEGGSAFFRFGVDAQVIPASDVPSFVNLAPREAGPSDEIRRMMRIMQLNHQARERQLLESVAALSGRLDDLAEAQEAVGGPSASEGSPVAAPAASPSTVPSS